MSSSSPSLFSQDRGQGSNSETFEMSESPPGKLHSDKSSSSGDEIIRKMRKPYTITKQRERWTDEEHQKFLEALKMYGRAWPRIEEHIGTKSAVQIRSHAQKFFAKLEQEASGRGIPMGEGQNISIPPPRPKRKPSNPYPRKAVATLEIGSSSIEQSSGSPKAVSFASHQISGGLNLADKSQKGRTAFQALFAQEVLPQSFSSPHHLRNSMHPNFNHKEHECIKQQPSKISEDKMHVDFQHDAANPIQLSNDHDIDKQVLPAPKTHCNDPISQSWEKKISDSELMVSGQSFPWCTDLYLGNAAKLMSSSKFQNLRYGQASFSPYKQCSIGTQINKPQMCSMENSEEHIREAKRICLGQEVTNDVTSYYFVQAQCLH